MWEDRCLPERFAVTFEDDPKSKRFAEPRTNQKKIKKFGKLVLGDWKITAPIIIVEIKELEVTALKTLNKCGFSYVPLIYIFIKNLFILIVYT